jgi:hypothetical protein
MQGRRESRRGTDVSCSLIHQDYSLTGLTVESSVGRSLFDPHDVLSMYQG